MAEACRIGFSGSHPTAEPAPTPSRPASVDTRPSGPTTRSAWLKLSLAANASVTVPEGATGFGAPVKVVVTVSVCAADDTLCVYEAVAVCPCPSDATT